jgi:peptide/nickel transport system substrate-binding protein
MAIFGSAGPVLMPNFNTTNFGISVMQCAFEAMFRYDTHLNFVPWLATSYSLSADSMTYTFKLRKGVKWSDGQPFTAADVEAAVLAMCNPATVTNWLTYVQQIEGANDAKAGKRSDVPGVEVVDDTTVRVTLTAPSCNFMDLFGVQFMPMPKHMLDQVPVSQLMNSSFASLPAVSTGAFSFQSRSADQSFTLVRNPHYWGGKAYLNKVIIQNTTTAAATPALISGALDVIPGEISGEVDPADAGTLKATNGITVTSYPNLTVTTLYANEKTLFSDLRVRQAVMYALDREGIIKSDLYGYAVVADSAYPPFSPYYDGSVITKYTQNIAKAKQLLAEAGWDSSTKVDFVVPTGDSTVQQAAVDIQQALQSVGINAAIDQVDFNTGVSRLIVDHTFDLGIFTNTGYNNPDLSRRFATASYKTGVNAGGYSSPHLDALMAQLLITPNKAAEKPLIDEIQQMISQDLPTIMMYYRDSIAAVNTAKIGGVTPQRGGCWLTMNKWHLL